MNLYMTQSKPLSANLGGKSKNWQNFQASFLVKNCDQNLSSFGTILKRHSWKNSDFFISKWSWFLVNKIGNCTQVKKSIKFKLLENFHKELHDVLSGPTRWCLAWMTINVYGHKTKRKRSFTKTVDLSLELTGWWSGQF